MQPTAVLPEALPSQRTLARAALVVMGMALLLAVGVVLPAETGRDPIGVGAVLGLTEMGRIKVALARDVAAEASLAAKPTARDVPETPAVIAASGNAWRDSMSVTLEPNKGIELKLAMRKDEKAFFAWSTDADEVYFNRHGEPPNAPKDFAAHSYAKGMAREDQGEIVAVYDGMHGWFWRNRSAAVVTITLKTRGQYRLLRQM